MWNHWCFRAGFDPCKNRLLTDWLCYRKSSKSFSKRLEGAGNKFAGLQISCAGYIGTFKMLFKENKVLQYKIDKADNEARNRISKNSSACLRKRKQVQGMFALHRGRRTCSSGGALGAGFFDLCQRNTMPKALWSVGAGCPAQGALPHQWEAPRHWTISKVAQGWE